MATTFRQAINRVLTDLREGDNLVTDGASELTDEYHIFIASIVNNMLEEVESAHEWWGLHDTLSVTYAASASSADMDTTTPVEADCRIYRYPCYHSGELLADVIDVTDSSDAYRLREMPLRLLVQKQAMSTDTQEKPMYFAYEPLSRTNGSRIRVHPKPNTERTIQVRIVRPQARLDHTTDLDTIIKAPVRPVVLGAVWYALSERGEELGTNLDLARERYMNALSDEVAADQAATGDERYDLLEV